MCEVGLTLDVNGNMLGYRIDDVRGQRKGGEEERVAGLPNGNENLILRRLGERARVYISGYIARFNSLEIDESFFRIDPAHVHLASVDAS